MFNEICLFAVLNIIICYKYSDYDYPYTRIKHLTKLSLNACTSHFDNITFYW